MAERAQRTTKEQIAKLRADARRLKAKGEEWILKSAAMLARADRKQRDADEAAGKVSADA